jgi:hypothetical protein
MGHAFSITLLTLIATFGAVDFGWGIAHLKSGEARWGWTTAKYTRQQKPFYFWLIVLARLVSLVVAFLIFRGVLEARW